MYLILFRKSSTKIEPPSKIAATPDVTAFPDESRTERRLKKEIEMLEMKLSDFSSNVSLPACDKNDIIIKKTLANGGFSSVYLGEWFGVKVALKEMADATSSTERADEFAAECKALSVLRHPHLLTGLGQCSSASRVYILTEFLEGGTLSDKLSDSSISSSWCKTICSQIISAIAFMHSRGYAHRDIKSVNVLLTGDGNSCKICDFGLTRHRTELNKGSLQDAGSPAYMPDECFSGGNVKVDPFSNDVFAIGVLVWEIYSGRVPFESSQGNLQSLISLRQSNLRKYGCALSLRALDASGRANVGVANLVAACTGDYASRPNMAKVLKDFLPNL